MAGMVESRAVTVLVISPEFRHPTEMEELKIIQDWYKDFRKETKTKSLGYFFASIFMLLAVILSIISIFAFFKSFLLSFLFCVQNIFASLTLFLRYLQADRAATCCSRCNPQPRQALRADLRGGS